MTRFLEVVPWDELDAVSSVLAGMAATVAVLIAYAGLQTWKKQLRGNAEFETARAALSAAYQTRDAIKIVRRAWHDIGEIAAAQVSTEADERYERSLYQERWKAILEAGDALRSAELEGTVLWGQRFKEAVEPLTASVADLSLAIGDYLRRLESKPPISGAGTESATRIVKSESSQRAGPDEFEQRVERAVGTVESFLRPRIAGHLLGRIGNMNSSREGPPQGGTEGDQEDTLKELWTYHGNLVHQRVNLFLFAESIMVAAAAALGEATQPFLRFALAAFGLVLSIVFWVALIRAQFIVARLDDRLRLAERFGYRWQPTEWWLQLPSTARLHNLIVPVLFVSFWIVYLVQFALTCPAVDRWLPRLAWVFAVLGLVAGAWLSLVAFKAFRRARQDRATAG